MTSDPGSRGAIAERPAEPRAERPAESTAAAWAPLDFRPHNCFACGTLNEHGLRLVIHVEPDRSWTELTLGRQFEGWEDIAHGGIVCTILDEVMAWSLVGADNWGVTARMSVDFRRPIPIGRDLRAEGRVTRSRRRIVETSGRIVDRATGEILATAAGLYLAADAARKRQLQERYGVRSASEAPGSVDVSGPVPADGRPAR